MLYTLDDKGREFIQGFETFQPIGYLPTPHDKPTAGWGHVGDVELGMAYSREQCDAWFEQDIAWAERAVSSHAREDLTQNQANALISICFNIGAPNFDASTLLKDVDAADDADAEAEFLRWDKQRGAALAGLERRRAAERVLYMTPDGS